MRNLTVTYRAYLHSANTPVVDRTQSVEEVKPPPGTPYPPIICIRTCTPNYSCRPFKNPPLLRGFHRRMLLPLLLVCVGLAHAYYDTFFFPATNLTCPGFPSWFGCNAPDAVCAHENVLNKYYCCSGITHPICRTPEDTCTGPKNTASSEQINCIYDQSHHWCCLQGTETCTQRTSKKRMSHHCLEFTIR